MQARNFPATSNSLNQAYLIYREIQEISKAPDTPAAAAESRATKTFSSPEIKPFFSAIFIQIESLPVMSKGRAKGRARIHPP